MGALAVISPLDISPGDRGWIESIRTRHDPQHAFIEPHFTLVFPFHGVGVSAVEQHVKTVAAATQSIPFRLCAVRVVADVLSPRIYVFLVPDLGESEIRDLHGKLYQGILASNLKADIPYEPHVTVAATEHWSDADVVSRSIGPVEIVGRLRELLFIFIDGRNVRELHRFPLQ